tara:strand:- start:443 stop:967 length:525 start_codon:yes stop_codon:yes gene_type:complete
MVVLRIKYSRPKDEDIGSLFQPNPRLWTFRMLAAHLLAYFQFKAEGPSAVKKTAKLLLTEAMAVPKKFDSDKRRLLTTLQILVKRGGGDAATFNYLVNLSNMLDGGEGFVHKLKTKVMDAYAQAKSVPSDIREVLDQWKDAPMEAIKKGGEVGFAAVGVLGVLGLALLFTSTRK